MIRKFELVSLDEYRHARAILAAREKIRKWKGLRFLNLDPWDWYILPQGLAEGCIFQKIEDHGAQRWTQDVDEERYFSTFRFNPYYSVPRDLPVIRIGFKV